MNLDETKQVLAKIQLYDSREVTRETVQAWQEILSDQTLKDCMDAVVEHFKSSTDWIRPAHIRANASSRRRKRIERAMAIEPPGACTTAGYLAFRRAAAKAAGDGLTRVEIYDAAMNALKVEELVVEFTGKGTSE